MDYQQKRVLSIGAVSSLTELTLRQIRYYEERKLIQPERTKGGTRQYSFEDVEKLVRISKKEKSGGVLNTAVLTEESKQNRFDRSLILGQLNAQFKR